MRKHFVLLGAASLMLGGFAWQAAAQSVHGEVDVGQPGGQPAGVAYAPATRPLAADSTDAKNIRDALARVTDNALTPHGASNLANAFIGPDSKRIIDQPVNYNDVDDQIRHFQTNWSNKYHRPFNSSQHEQVVYNDQAVQFYPGAWPEARMAGAQMHGEAQVGGAGAAGEIQAAPTTRPQERDTAARKSFSGLDAATAIMPASHGLPPVTVVLVPEGNIVPIWRVDVPDTLSNQRLHDNLLQQVTALNNSQDQWPSDVNDAYRAVAHRMLAAVTDTPTTGTAQPAGGQQGYQPGNTDSYRHDMDSQTH